MLTQYSRYFVGRLKRIVTAASRLTGKVQNAVTGGLCSVEERPWEHPFLTERNISRFRQYSLTVRELALAHARAHPTQLNLGFSVNLAQSMYKWARMTQKAGAAATLYLHSYDARALTYPEWEDYDGAWPDLLDGAGFLQAHPEIVPEVPCVRVELRSECEHGAAWSRFQEGDRRALLRCMARTPSLRFDSLWTYQGVYAFLLPWAEMLARHDAVCTAYFPLAAYLSGRPYCAYAVGDDVQYDCGRPDALGQLMAMSFAGARFLWMSNPYYLGHCRRLGFVNGLHVPYPMDDSRYCPGVGRARREWEAQHGPGFYVLATARIDDKVKGNGASLFQELAALAGRLPQVRFVFLAWGQDVAAFRERIAAAHLQRQFLLLEPVGKTRLIDYYRSSDCVLDQFVYGYYGATGLEACAVGKPVVMRIRTEHYSPLYGGDVAPVLNCAGAREAAQAIEGLAGNPERCARAGAEARAWLVRNHGEAVTTPLLLALLQFARDNRPLPPDLCTPLREDETEEEAAYHRSRLRPLA
jgi:glycosyltransferase involved in cell wall biosynthesis